MTDLRIEHLPIRALRPYKRNARTHSQQQIRQIADSIREFGFTNPVLISDEREIIAGHGRVEAAKLLGFAKVPCLRLSHLSEAQRRAYVIADNQLATKAGWSSEILATELQALVELDFSVELTGFSTAEIDLIIGGEDEKTKDTGPADHLPSPGPLVTRRGDLWLLGEHRLICGDSRERGGLRRAYGRGGGRSRVHRPALNVKIDGNVCGLGAIQHESSRSPRAR